MKATTAIVGVGSTPYYFRGTSPDTTFEMIDKAILAAVADAGLTLDEIDGIALFAAGFDPSQVVQQLGLDNLTFAHTVSGYGSAICGMLDLAAMGIETGRVKNVVCVGQAHNVGRRTGQALGMLGATTDGIFHTLAGLGGPGQAVSLLARRHMHRYGTRREAFGEVVIASRLAAATREGAIRRKPLTMDEYLASPMLADPLCRLDFCLECDGALAMVISSAERAADMPHKPVYVTGAALAGSSDWGRGFFAYNQTDDAFVSAGHGDDARRLWQLTGLGPKDIDVALLYDSFSPLVLMQLEDYGFCARGESGPFVESGAIRLDGSIPVNPHGGHLSEAYIMGMTNFREATEQLRGTAVNQIKDAKRVLVTGGTAPILCSSAILSNER